MTGWKRHLGWALLATACACCGSDGRGPGAARGDSASLTPDTMMTSPPSSPEAAVLERFRRQLPPALLVRRGACPFECCVYRDWKAESDIPVVAAERSSAPPLFTIRAGEQFRADSGNVWITGLMLAVVTDSVGDADYWSFVPGDTLVVLDHLGEGYVNVWHDGRLQAVEAFWDFQPNRAVRIGEHQSEWWVHATLPDGRSGWFDALADVQIGNADACGGPQ